MTAMNCKEVQFKISEWLDQTTSEAAQPPFQDHLKSCQNCEGFYLDVQSILKASRDLPVFDPPARLWGEIEDRLKADGIIGEKSRSSPVAPSLWQRLFPSGFWPGLKPALAGAIVAIILSASAFYVYVRQERQPIVVATDPAITEELRQAELHYQRAIQALSEVSQRKIDAMDPAMAQILNDNLATMDYYVKECQDAVKNGPDNPLVHRYLLTAYQKKIEIMQSILNSDVM
jgi:hypothetical protein